MILSKSSILKPFITDITIIKVPTPKTIPKKENRDIIEFELAASFDLQGVRLPKRQVLPADFPGVGSFYS